jgi:hypothetical protein
MSEQTGLEQPVEPSVQVTHTSGPQSCAVLQAVPNWQHAKHAGFVHFPLSEHHSSPASHGEPQTLGSGQETISQPHVPSVFFRQRPVGPATVLPSGQMKLGKPSGGPQLPSGQRVRSSRNEHTPASQNASLPAQGSTKHWTPGVGQTGSFWQIDSDRQSHPVHVSENVRQSLSLRQGPAGGGWQICCVQTPSGGVQMPQLALQHTCPTGQVVGPHTTGFGGHVP